MNVLQILGRNFQKLFDIKIIKIQGMDIFFKPGGDRYRMGSEFYEGSPGFPQGPMGTRTDILFDRSYHQNKKKANFFCYKILPPDILRTPHCSDMGHHRSLNKVAQLKLFSYLR